MTRIDIAVLPQQPCLLYLHPRAEKYPEDIYKYTRFELEQFIKNKDEKWKYKVTICEKQIEDGNGETFMETIGFAVWEISALKGEKNLPASRIHLEGLAGEYRLEARLFG